jgi:hypothetical protein
MWRCEEIRHLLKNVGHNIEEARDKIHKAYELLEKSEALAAWHKDMAARHLDFNETAVPMVRKHLDEMRREHKGHDREPDQMAMGKCEAYEEWLEQLLPRMAEVRAMIDRFGK